MPRRRVTASIPRQQVLAYRAFVQGLHRDTDALGDLRVLDLGVQDTPPGSAAHGLANRLRAPSVLSASTSGLSVTWSVRGAPHVHRADDLVALSRALWPWSDTDALARLDTSSSPVRSSGMRAREALRFVAEQIADIVTQPLPKGEVSTALTPRVPAAMIVDCRACQATHIVETLFRSAVLPAGITFDPKQPVVTFVPVPDWPGVPEETHGAGRVVASYLRLLGPATVTDVAAFVGTKPSELASQWPDGLAEVDVDGESRWIPAVLQARDRELLVPDRSQQKTLWPALGRPGALLVHGDVAGVWRGRKKGRRLELTVQPFRRLATSIRRGIEEEAALAAQVRGVADATITVE